MVDYKKQGKRNRDSGARFERKVREDLEGRGWIVSKWHNNVEFEEPETNLGDILTEKGSNKRDMIRDGKKHGKCVPAKPGKFRMMQTGYPDFIAYKLTREVKGVPDDYEIIHEPNLIFVEVKKNGYLKPEEREKARWYLENNYCSKFYIARSKTDENDRRKKKVVYEDFEEKY